MADNLANRRIRQIDRIKPDLLLQDELCHPSLFGFNRKLRKKITLPLIAIVHHLFATESHPPWRQKLAGVIEKHYLASVDGFIFNSQTTRRMVFEALGRKTPHVVAVPGGNRFDRLTPSTQTSNLSLERGPLRLLFVGMVIERKGLLALIESLGRMVVQNWRLDVVGSLTHAPAYVRRCRHVAEKKGLMSRIRFWGLISDRDLRAKMAAADLLCMPFAYEGFGIVTLEALTCGLPVLGSSVGATPELVSHGVNGLLFAPGDLQGVADALDHLASKRKCLTTMRVFARQRAEQQPTWQTSMKRAERFLKQMATTQS
jgi:glycosyltransferase involved in cell wall biosynthesis